jgi:predicted nucleic acid-binding protein
MKYVLDISVALRWVIPDPLTAKALQLRDDYLHKLHELLAPDIFPAEAASGLTKAERQKLIAVGQAAPLNGKIATATPDLHPYGPLTPRAIDISSRTRSAFYDCLYVALAEREGCQLVTADKKLINNLQAQFPFIAPLASLP